MLTTASPSHSAAGTCCKTIYTRGHRILVTFCPFDMSHKVQRVELRVTCRRETIAAKFVLHEPKIISTRAQGDVSLQHVSGTCPCYIFLGVCVLRFCRCFIFPAATRSCFMPLQCEQRMIWSLLHLTATCLCVFSPHVRRALCLYYSAPKYRS